MDMADDVDVRDSVVGRVMPGVVSWGHSVHFFWIAKLAYATHEPRAV